jgi:hypothetical protein
LLGLFLRVELPEYYLSLFGGYLCYLMLRRAWKSEPKINPVQPKKVSGGGSKRALPLLVKNLLPISILILMVAYPVWAFAQSLNNQHIYYLGITTVVLLYLFLISKQPGLLIYILCMVFVQGALYLLIFGESGEPVNLFLALIGTLIIVNHILINRPSVVRFFRPGDTTVRLLTDHVNLSGNQPAE